MISIRGILTLVALVFALPTSALWAKPSPCPAARYLVQGEPLIPGSDDPFGVYVGNGSVSLDGACGLLTTLRTKARRRATNINAKWISCLELGSGVRIVAKIPSPACSTLVGKFKAKDAGIKRRFVAMRSDCGDSVVDLGGGEECDDANAVSEDGCSEACVVEYCGDAAAQSGLGEECDDGNVTDGDGCNASCLAEICGDGIVQSGLGEECDDGNTVEGDECDSNCSTPRCGNGVVAPGEQCDDGNGVDGDGCEGDCTLPYCGNSIVDVGEECDDSNAVNGDGCDANCAISRCGNGAVAPGEGCDDGNLVAGDGCSATCEAEVCGDFVLQTGLGESCDDGNTVSDDGCSATCRVEVCGDGITQLGRGEQCDDGNSVTFDGCEPNCTRTPRVYALLGTWKFVYTLLSTWTDTFYLQRVEYSQGVPLAVGTDQFGGTVAAVRNADIVPDPIGYEFSLLNPGSIICEFFVFNLTGSSSVSGVYYQTYVNFDGTCGDIRSNGYSMHGTRTSLAAVAAVEARPRAISADRKVVEATSRVNGVTPSESEHAILRALSQAGS